MTQFEELMRRQYATLSAAQNSPEGISEAIDAYADKHIRVKAANRTTNAPQGTKTPWRMAVDDFGAATHNPPGDGRVDSRETIARLQKELNAKPPAVRTEHQARFVVPSGRPPGAIGNPGR